jgi:acetyl esterase/lipase
MPAPRPALVVAFVLAQLVARGSEPAPLALWPGAAPGEIAALPPEADITKATDQLVAGRRVIRLGNVSTPTITVYRPEASRDTGVAVLVCPGGGYYILAMDLEGTEVCAWLNSIGVTAVLLKYRVPAQPGQARQAAPLQDAQRALGLVRYHAAEWRIDARRIGVLGFSAGGHLAAMLASNHSSRAYPVVDAADAVSCRPDFTVLIYPAYLVADGTDGPVRPEVAPHRTETPPVFLAMAEDDPGWRIPWRITSRQDASRCRWKCIFIRPADTATACGARSTASPRGRTGSPTGWRLAAG